MRAPTSSLPVDTPVGRLVLESDGEVLVAIRLPPPTPGPVGRAPQPLAGDSLPTVLGQAADQLQEYFSGERRRFEVPMDLDGTGFQREVWAQLALIPYGETITYRALAHRVGRPTGYRAVGQANGRNPVPIIVPCHRVVASDGLGGYGGGLAVKRSLLALEGRLGRCAGPLPVT